MKLTIATLNALIDSAISGDSSSGRGGFIQVMAGKESRAVQNDIPTAYEMYTLLQYYLGKLPVEATTLAEDLPEIDLTPRVLHDAEHGRLVLLIHCEQETLPYVAHYVADRIPSGELKKRPGVLALSFSIENHDGVDHLIPEWHAAFYVDNDPGHCIPVLALQAVLSDDQFSGDWVDVALNRMAVFRLPREKAQAALAPRRKQA